MIFEKNSIGDLLNFLASLPQTVVQLNQTVNDLTSLAQVLTANNQKKADAIFDIDEAAAFLNLTKNTLYSKVSNKELPYMKRGKRLYFSESDLTDYIKKGKVKTNADLQAEAETYLLNKKRLK